MKRVLHLTTHLNIGGITSYIKLITREMQKSGYEFYVGSSGGTQEPYLEKNRVKLLRLNIRTKSEISPKVFLVIKPLIAFIKKEKIDVIHAHTRVTQILSWWVQRFTGIPYVSTCHGFYKNRLGRRLIPGWGNRVIAISKPVEDSLTKQFRINPEKTITVFNAIDITELTRQFQEKNPDMIRKELKLAPSCKVLGIIARVVEDKGHEYFLRAVKKIRNGRFPNIKVLIVGEGPFIKKTKELAGQLNLQNVVLFLGNLQDVTYALAVIDIFVLPAIWREGFGLSIIEAMAVCRPVIVTNIWSLNELITNRVNGLLVEPKDVDGLAKAIEQLIQDNELRETIAHNGCEMVKREFSIPNMSSRMNLVYESVLKNSAEKTKSKKKHFTNQEPSSIMRSHSDTSEA
jgi:glycosyltransferase involved in cell wall biosynthesis